MGMLDDIRVLDFSHQYFGPYSTMIMGDMGAEIIKIEPPWGEMVRIYPPHYGGVSTVFHYLNRNKKGISLNLKDSEGKKIVLELAKKCDVVIENFKRGTMEKLGLGYDEIKKIKPDIIYFIDVALFQGNPGDIKLFQLEDILNMSVSTHNFPITVFKQFFSDSKIKLIGIKPKSLDVNESLSPELEDKFDNIVQRVKSIILAT